MARILFEAVGLGAYFVVLSLAALDASLLRRQKISEGWLRGAGWLMSLVGFATFASLAMPELSPGPVIGAGGYLGAAARGVLEMHFAAAGSYILTISLLAGGLLLSTDYLLLRLSAWLVAGPAKGVGMAIGGVGQIYEKRRSKVRTDLGGMDEAKNEAGASSLQIRISGKPVEAVAAVAAAAAAADEPADAGAVKQPAKAKEEAEAAEVPSDAPSAKQEAASEPRVRPPLKKKDARQQVMHELDAAVSKTQESTDYELPPIDLLLESEPFAFEEQEKEVRRKAKILEKTFANFGFNVRVVEIETGPVIAQFEVELEAGLRLSKITGLADDLAIALRVPSVRIVAPIPGKNTVGIEVPNEERPVGAAARSDRRGQRQGPENARSRSSWARTCRAIRWWSTWRRCRTC